VPWCGSSGVLLHVLLSLILYGGKYSDLGLGRFVSGEMVPQLIGEKDDLDSVELREIIALDDRRREHIFPAPPSHKLSIPSRTLYNRAYLKYL
jgi:hypothetical protein